MNRPKNSSEWLWEAWCIASIIGIWPRYIEPKILKTTYLSLIIPSLPKELDNLKIVHLSDLHWYENFSKSFIQKITNKVKNLKPELIFFTGDFLCRSRLENPQGLIQFLNSLQAPFGCFAVLGNHDYQRFVTVNEKGEYDVEKFSIHPPLIKGFKKLFHFTSLKDEVTDQAKQVPFHQPLIDLLKETSFQLLHNETQTVPCRQSYLNICGMGEYSLGRFIPEQAFKKYNKKYPGIVLSHHPDTLTVLKEYPGDLILSGHTHGGQVNLPGLWKKFTSIKHHQFKSGLKKLEKKWSYISRGLGGLIPFRWFASPELTCIILKKEN